MPPTTLNSEEPQYGRATPLTPLTAHTLPHTTTPRSKEQLNKNCWHTKVPPIPFQSIGGT